MLGGQKPPRCHFGDLEIDPAAHRCHRAGQNIALTVREFAVLMVPADARSSARATPWTQPSTTPTATDINIVDVHISALRRKIDKSFRHAAIETSAASDTGCP